MDSDKQPKPLGGDDSSLEGTSTVVESSDSPQTSSTNTGLTDSEPKGSPTDKQPRLNLHFSFGKIVREFNIYLLTFLLILLIAAAILIITLSKSHSTNQPKTSAQNLTQSQLEQIAAGNENVGNANQVLNIGSNTIVNGQLLVRKDLDVAGSIKVGENLSLPGLSVSGTSTFDQIEANKLTVSGTTTFQSGLMVGQTLNVAGSATFGGAVSVNQLTAQSLQLSGDLILTHHIQAGGTTPSRSTGGAVGGGGTTSISGSDTAGSISINTGSGASAGCFITVNFTEKFNATPHVVITPVGASAAGLAYYVNRSTTSFSVCTTSTPPSGTSFGFDYIVFD